MFAWGNFNLVIQEKSMIIVQERWMSAVSGEGSMTAVQVLMLAFAFLVSFTVFFFLSMDQVHGDRMIKLMSCPYSEM